MTTKTMADRSKKKSGLRERILSEARKALKKKSADQISLRSIARSCGVSEAAPYRHFRDREDLLACLAIEGFGLLRDHVQAVVDAKLDPKTKFLAAASAYLSMGENHPELLRLIFGEGLPGGAEYPELRRAGKLSFLALVRVIQECQAAGLIAHGDTVAKAMHTWMSLHGFTLLYISHRCEWLGLQNSTVHEALRSFALELLTGLTARQEKGFNPEICELSNELLQEAGVISLELNQ
jgi:AcrR family transcriptional regulator